MIPVKLNLRNFLSYRENVPTLDFTGVHVACLCGDNGHGKSALLDAITWCLWGHARGQVQDDLVSYGADEARVELDFLARDGRFRVIRSRRRVADAAGKALRTCNWYRLPMTATQPRLFPAIPSGKPRPGWSNWWGWTTRPSSIPPF